ncbi:putative C6 transcription factor [Emericellopsis atlantica]|uniref:C6 transcription factor n=1 Tax=Emericellopsis atlantica TaxID=2614577 RepID=A0A9P8CPW7_9HYPO|nr:putative C6 transcription factor [Emericellopsis atlantica]KAG9255299.1 putative C6 transcription factor [Emericellopsis atlantica]
MSGKKRPKPSDDCGDDARGRSRAGSTAATSTTTIAGITNGQTQKPLLTRACAECKRHKIKCFVQPGETACTKCVKSGIHCVPHNFAQKFIDDDAAWKSQATSTLEQLKEAVEHLLQRNDLPELAKLDGTAVMQRSLQQQQQQQHTPSVQTLSPLTTDHTSLVEGNFTSEGPSAGARDKQDDSDLVPLPMNNLYNLTDPNNSRLIRVDPADVNGPDLISQGVLSLAEAEFLFNHYRDHINPLLWDGILCSHTTLTAARQSSSLLVTVVLTVAALHVPNREQSLHATYGAFVSLMRGSCLLRCHNLDIIRALCIGSFYLTSLSWALCSRAVRVATEMNLHKSSLRFARGCQESYERVRLWYVLYVCDHQFALAYGRPPLMHEDAAIRNAEKLLSSGLSSKGDHGLIAQVKLFRILSSGYFMYGCDPDLELADQDFERLQRFNISVDHWRLEHSPTKDKEADAKASSIPSKANTLYYHLARFQLNAVSLRNISAREVAKDEPNLDMNLDRQEASNIAITSAMSTARLIADDEDLQRALIGLPIFTHAMVAVCANFLLKMAVVFGEADVGSIGDKGAPLYIPRDLSQYGLNFHTKTALATVERLVVVLERVADHASQRHVARQVVTGLRELLQRFSPGRTADCFIYSLTRAKEHAHSSSSTHRWRSMMAVGYH